PERSPCRSIYVANYRTVPAAEFADSAFSLSVSLSRFASLPTRPNSAPSTAVAASSARTLNWKRDFLRRNGMAPCAAISMMHLRAPCNLGVRPLRFQTLGLSRRTLRGGTGVCNSAYGGSLPAQFTEAQAKNRIPRPIKFRYRGCRYPLTMELGASRL